MKDRLEEVGEEKEVVMEEAAEFKQREGEDEDFPEYLEEEWEDLDNEEISLRGEIAKFTETVVVYSDQTNIVDKPEEQCKSDERTIRNLSEDDIKEAYADVDKCYFTVKELTFGQLQGVSDDMMEQSFEVDMDRQDIEGTPKQGYYQIQLLKESIQRWPFNAPVSTDNYGNETPEPAEYPVPVGEWLFERVDALNTSGDTEMGNSSLEEAMKLKN